MITVINQPEIVTRCNTCGTVLQYQPSDVQKRTKPVYRGFFGAPDYVVVRFIKCPICKCEVVL